MEKAIPEDVKSLLKEPQTLGDEGFRTLLQKIAGHKFLIDQEIAVLIQVSRSAICKWRTGKSLPNMAARCLLVERLLAKYAKEEPAIEVRPAKTTVFRGQPRRFPSQTAAGDPDLRQWTSLSSES